MASVTLQNIQKKFSRNIIIKDLSLEIQNGEFITLLGPSGCGKSTTLNMIAGLEKCSLGKILFDAKDVTELSPAQRNIAMVFQSYALYPHLNVFDNIAFPLSARKMPKEEIKKQVQQAAQRLELSELLQRYPKELSGGQRQRVALGRAIVRTPSVFLFDEPLSNLDAALKVVTRSEIKKLHQDLKSTMIYVTHDQEEAMSLSDRIAIFKLGELQQFATPFEVYHQPVNLFVAAFIGSPAMNLWSGEVKEKTFLEIAETKFPIPEIHNKTKVTIGIRPHEFSISREKTENALQGTVVTSQPMGECCYLDLKIAGKRTMVRADADIKVKPEETLYLTYQKDKVHCFDEFGSRC